MLSILITILVFAFTISLLVFIHEGGHYLVAKRAGVWVHEFAIGFGPAIWRRKWGETQYALRILPLGGFGGVAGEEAQSEEDQQVPSDRLYTAKPPLARVAIVLAGPLMNILAAVLLMIAYFSFFGTPFVEIAEVAADSPARSVLQSGDKLIELRGEQIYFPEQIQSLVQRSEGHPLEAVIDRGGQRLTVAVTPYRENPNGPYFIGIHFSFPLNQIAELPEGSGLARQGLQKGDIIQAVDGKPIGSWPEFLQEMSSVLQKQSQISLRVRRGQTRLDLPIDSSQIAPHELKQVKPQYEPVPATYPIVQQVKPDSFLAQQGVRPGDRLISANGEEISSLSNLLRALLRASGGDGHVRLVLQQGEETRSLEFSVSGMGMPEILQGLQLQVAQRKPGIWASIPIGFRQIRDTIVLLYVGIKQVITGQASASEAFRGPVGIANLLGWSLTRGFDYFIRLVALLSLVLGVFNLIPFPALDGSRVVFALYEMVRGKPIPAEKEGWVHYVGFIFLMGLSVLITWQDIQRRFRGEL